MATLRRIRSPVLKIAPPPRPAPIPSRSSTPDTSNELPAKFWKIRLPAALPQVFVGLKGAAINATVGATIAEWIGGNAGLGYYIQVATGDFNMRLALSAIIMLTALGLLLYFLVILAEMKLIPWHESQRKRG